MKLSNETKVGVLAIVAIIVLVLGFNFLKGKKIFSNPTVLYAKFTEIGSLEKSNQVKINGLPVGTVSSISQADKTVDFIIIEIHLTRDILIPSNSIAFIDASILGAAHINIEKGDATNYYNRGDTIKTRLDQGIIGNIQSQLMPTVTRVNETLDSMKIAIGAITGVFDPHTKHNIQDIIANLSVSTNYLQQLLNTQSGTLAKSLANVNSVTGNLSKNNEAISTSIHNVELTTTKLSKVDIDGIFNTLQSAAGELKSTISQLNSKSGSIGLLMNDRELYDRINKVADRVNKAALSAEITIDDLRLHPKRYVNLSVFGGKNKGQPLSSPAVKDTVPK